MKEVVPTDWTCLQCYTYRSCLQFPGWEKFFISLPTGALLLNLHTGNRISWWGARSLLSGAFLMWLGEVKGPTITVVSGVPSWPASFATHAPPYESGHADKDAFKGSSSGQVSVLWSWVCFVNVETHSLLPCISAKPLREMWRWAGKQNFEGNIKIEIQSCRRREITVWTEVRKWKTSKYVPHNLLAEQKNSPEL